ncbi:acyl-CoA/acyl-ACP dehydrogenase [Streptomyces sp. NBC_01136]|uniref:acyl-CoA dehydrogenase family protein n=1 Tax=unclassified Streptomyces TaxID=2593676 RepID=UPI003245924F|nr:acyl-CoA/acyl-ACP dehydrogenase [Streptomyces sp. NBC_01136]
MDLDFTDDQTALRDTLRTFFEKEASTAAVRAAEPLGFDAALWRKVVDLGLGAIAVPEQHGGGGAGFVELAIAAECLGQSLAPVPLIEAAVANDLIASLSFGGSSSDDDGGSLSAGSLSGASLSGGSLSDGPDPRLESLAARAVAGELLATLALRPATGDVARLVPAGAVADLVVVLRGDELLLLRQPDRSPSVPGGAVHNLGALPLADCRIDAENTLVMARGPAAVRAHRRALSRWELLTGAALVGLASKALDIGIDYVMQRKAFGVLIGTFQTIQHRLADDVIALDGARLLAYEAAWAQDENLPTADTLATMAFLFSSETAFKTASEVLHFHGGYGYTLEYDIQLYFRRAKAWSLVAGDSRAAYARLAHRVFGMEEAPEEEVG